MRYLGCSQVAGVLISFGRGGFGNFPALFTLLSSSFETQPTISKKKELRCTLSPRGFDLNAENSFIPEDADPMQMVVPMIGFDGTPSAILLSTNTVSTFRGRSAGAGEPGWWSTRLTTSGSAATL